MAETRLEVIYNVTSTTYTTQLFNVTGNFVKAELGDGTQLPDSIFNQENKAYLFDQTGLTSVYYTLCGNTLVNDEFDGMTRIVGVNVPSTVTSIPERCFRNCTNLSDAYITSSVTNIASGAFENTAIEFFEIPATSVTIGDRVFAGCSALTALTVYAPTAPSISQYTFYQVHTGGTLTYPSGSDYSSWLSNNEYYLGYYGWTGDTPTPTVKNISLDISNLQIFVPSGASSQSAPVLTSGCTYSGFTYVLSGDPSFAITATTGANDTIVFNFPANNTSSARNTIVELNYYDTDGNVYSGYPGGHSHESIHFYQSAGSGETPTPSASISFTDSTAQINADSTGKYCNLTVCGCTLDAERLFEIVSLSGDLPLYASSYTITSMSNLAKFGTTANPGSTERTSTVVCRFYDTSGNSYTDDITITQSAGAAPSASISFRNDAVTINANELSAIAYIDVSGCTYDYTRTEFSAEGDEILRIESTRADRLYIKVSSINTGTTQLSSVCTVRFYDTSGNSYDDSITVLHAANAFIVSVPNELNINYSAQTVCSEIESYNYTDPQFEVYQVNGSSNWGGVYPTPVINGNQVCVVMPENTSSDTRHLYVYVQVASGSTSFPSPVYRSSIIIRQSGTPVTERYIKFTNTGATTPASSTAKSTRLQVCGCTCDMSRGFDIISLQGDFHVSAGTITGSTSFVSANFVFERNSGTTELASSITCRFYDTSGNSYDSTIRLTHLVNAYSYIEPQRADISHSAQTVCANITSVHYTDPYYVVYTVSGSSNWDGVYPTPVINGNRVCVDMPENTSGGSKSLSVKLQTCGTTSYNLPEGVVELKIYQSGAPVAKDIRVYPEHITAQSADTEAYCDILTSGCVFSSFTVTERSGDAYTSGPEIASGGIRLKFTFSQNQGARRTENFLILLYDTEGNSYSEYITVSQEEKGEGPLSPLPWDNTGDTAYTWYSNDVLRILPASKILADSETIAYYPVTAHSFNNVEVRASGDVVFTYELSAETNPDYNSHSLYLYTEDNTGLTQQASIIKLVAYSGSSAYSATTELYKNPYSHGWITASPNPVNAASTQNSVNVYLTLTSCQRNISKETTDNVEFDEATWISVSRVNNTALTFNFQANTTNAARSTYYYAYGLDNSGNNVYCRIDITQEADSMGITITPDRTSLGKPAGSFTARVESTENGNFSFSADTWMTITSYVPSSQKSGTLYIDYYENNNEWPRSGDIFVTQQISTAPYTLTAKTQIFQTNTADTAYIRVTPSSISVDRTAGVVEAQVSYAGLATVPALVQNEGNMSIVSYNLDSGLITIAYGANDTSMDKYKNFAVTAMSSNGNVIEANFSITQGGTGLPVAPIWRDYVITVPTPGQGYINYNINYDGTVVYTGRAYGMGQDNIEIYYNHLCKPFLSNHIDFTEGYQSIRDWLGNFIITSPELGDITSVSFYEDYSYVNRDITNVMSLNNPIINEVVEGSYVPFSFFITGASGNVSIMQNGQQITGLTVNDNEQHRYFVEAEKGKTYSSLGAVYKTIPVCSARYSLYYVNSFGGVDVLPFKGKSFKKTDNITRLNYSRSFRNNTLEFENVNYMNEMKPAWELNTSYMVDSQSRKMHELVESTCVYLYDAEEQTYTPVVMTDKKLEYKTFYNQGRRFYTYTINVEESQSRERR